MIQHAALVRRFHGERSLPDGVIENTSIADWAAVLGTLRDRGWSLNVSEDLVVSDLFSDADDFEFVTIKVTPIEGVQVNIFPHQQNSIQFDFDTAELRTQVEVDALMDFIAAIGDSIDKSVVVYHEGGHTNRLLAFDVSTGEVRFAD